MFNRPVHTSGALLLVLAIALAMQSPSPSAFAQPAAVQTAAVQTNQPAAPAAEVRGIRFSQGQNTVRIVLDMNRATAFTTGYLTDPLRFVVEMPGAVNGGAISSTVLNDPFVGAVRLEDEPGRLKMVVDLKLSALANVFALQSPHRIVIDIVKVYEQKLQEEVMAGLRYTSWLQSTPAGPVSAHILDIDPKAGFQLRPILSNDIVPGLETLSSIAGRTKAVAAVNAGYFAASGEILGLMKLDGGYVSFPAGARSAASLFPDGRVIIDQIGSQATVGLGDGRSLVVTGLNRPRGNDELILYNRYWGSFTDTPPNGLELILQDGAVKVVRAGNSPIPADGWVLSAHGAYALTLKDVKEGDWLSLRASLGEPWEQAPNIVGAGPTLVKGGSVFLTTKLEDFGSDVAGGRAPRTAIGATKDGRILLVVVDGRQSHSVGMTLLELATLLHSIGAVEAMNLDGGGSSQMILNDRTVNRPSDGRERKIGAALAVFSVNLAH